MTHRMTAAQLIEMQKPKAKPRVDREGPIHRTILDHLRVVLPPNTVIHHSPNAIGLSGQQIMRQIALNEAMGTVKGFPDLICILPGPRFWLFEVKAEGNYPDPDQRALHDRLRGLGCAVAVVRNILDVDAAIASWGGVDGPLTDRQLRDMIVGGSEE